MTGKITEPRVISDYRQEPACILPAGFRLDDSRWTKIWARYAEKGEALTHDDLREMFPGEPALKINKP